MVVEKKNNTISLDIDSKEMVVAMTSIVKSNIEVSFQDLMKGKTNSGLIDNTRRKNQSDVLAIKDLVIKMLEKPSMIADTFLKGKDKEEVTLTELANKDFATKVIAFYILFSFRKKVEEDNIDEKNNSELAKTLAAFINNLFNDMDKLTHVIFVGEKGEDSEENQEGNDRNS